MFVSTSPNIVYVFYIYVQRTHCELKETSGSENVIKYSQEITYSQNIMLYKKCFREVAVQHIHSMSWSLKRNLYPHSRVPMNNE